MVETVEAEGADEFDGRWGSFDGMVEKARVARESPAMARRIALNIIVVAMTRVQWTQMHTSGMYIEYER